MASQNVSHQRANFTAQSFLTQLLQPSLEQLAERIVELPWDCSVEQIHQSRVVIRTFRAQLDTFRPLLSKRETLPVEQQLKQLNSLLGPLRNTDVSRELLNGDLLNNADEEHDLKNFTKHIVQDLTEQRNQEIRVLREHYKEKQTKLLDKELAELLRRPPIRKRVLELSVDGQQQIILGCLDHERERLLKLASRTRIHPTNRQLHRVRIQAKQVRYAYEAAHTQGVVSDKKTIEFAQRLHGLLGNHQDLVILETWLKNLETIVDSDRPMKAALLERSSRQRRKIVRKYEHYLESGIN